MLRLGAEEISKTMSSKIMKGQNSTLSQGGFCTSVTINSQAESP
ncbi:hypothetical protein [Coleofasciculus sp.]